MGKFEKPQGGNENRGRSPLEQHERFLEYTKDGFPVIDRYNSHLKEHREVLAILPEALKKVDTKGRPFIEDEVSFDHTIGKSFCVKTSENDEIVYARRRGRKGLSRFVLNREPEDTNKVSLVLKKIRERVSQGKDAREVNAYLLITAWIGERAEVEYYDPRATEKSLAFWNTHALIYDPELIIPGTETKEKPW